MSDAAPERTAPVKQPGRELGGVAWFTLMVGMWSAFSTLLIASPETLRDVWSWLTGLPLAAEVVMWILLLPWALALAAWQSSWDEWIRLLIVALLGATWTASSKPRLKR